METPMTLDRDSTNQNKLTVKRAAELMGVGEQFIRIGLQKKALPFGYAVQISRNRYTYYISPKLFSETTGIEINP